MLRAVFAYGNLDSTADLNLRFEKLITPGIFSGGEITANGTNNTVTIAPFRALTREGLVVLDDSNTNITIPGNQKTFICLRVQYAAPSQPDVAWVLHTQSSYNADPNKQFLIRFGTVDLASPVSAGPVFTNKLSYQDRDAVTPVGYDKFLGVYSDLAALTTAYPSVAPTKQKHDDIALCSSGVSSLPTWYKWNSGTAAFEAFNSYTSDIALLNSHISNSAIHVTASQSAALAGTAGVPGAANRYVTETDVTRILDPAERQAIANAVGLDAGLSDQNPLVADKLPVVSHLLIQMVADGGNVAAITPASFGGSSAIVYVGKQGVNGNGRSSASQYFNIEDLFGDGLAPNIGGIDSPVTINNVSWNATTGATLNPSSNPQVDQNGFLTINPGQTLYLNLNINVPLSTQYIVRMNVKGRVRDLVPNWNAPVSYPARAAATAFRSGRQPYVLANTGDFKTFRVGDPVKSNVFISADQVGYPSSGYVKMGFYAGSNIPGNLKGLFQAYVGTVGVPALAIAFNTFSICNDVNDINDITTVFRVRDAVYSKKKIQVVYDPTGTDVIEAAPKRVILEDDGTIQAFAENDVSLFGAVPKHTFIANKYVGMGYSPSVSYSDPGGTTTYDNVVHIRGGRGASTLNRNLDLLLLSSPSSDYDVEANADETSFVIHKATKLSDTSATFTLWARSNYGSSTNPVLNLSVLKSKSPSPTISIGISNFFQASGVDATGSAVRTFGGMHVSSGTFTAENKAQFKSGLKTFSGLNNLGNQPALEMRVNTGSSIVNAAGITPYNSTLLRLNSDTSYGVAGYVADQAGTYRAGFVVGNSDAVFLPNATNFGSVRFGAYGYQMLWDKETPSSDLSSCIVIEESNTPVRELLIGRRAANAGLFQYATAVRIKEGTVTLPYISDATDMLNFGGIGALSVNASGVSISYGGTAFTVTNTGAAIGQAPVSGGTSRLDMSGYGYLSMIATTFTLAVGANVNDRILFGGTAGAMALTPNTTNVTDIGSVTKNFKTIHARGLNLEHFVFGTGAAARVTPVTHAAVDLGSDTFKFQTVYTLGIATEHFVMGANHITPLVDNVASLGNDTVRYANVFARNLKADVRYSKTVSDFILSTVSATYTGAAIFAVPASDYVFTFCQQSVSPFIQGIDSEGVDWGTTTAHKVVLELPSASANLDREITLTIRALSVAGGSAIAIRTSTSVVANVKKRQYLSINNWTSYTLKLKAVPYDVYLLDAPLGTLQTGNPAGASWLVQSITEHAIYS